MSLSINTNSSAMVALETLNATQTELSAAQNAVSTGKKVSSAADNPASYAISQQMGGNISGLAAINDGLSFTSSIVSTTSTAVDKILTSLKTLQESVTSLGSHVGDSASVKNINDSINGTLNQINEIARGATSNGVNLLVPAGTPPAGTGAAQDAYGVTSNSLSYATNLEGSITKIDNASGTIATALTSESSNKATTVVSLTDALGLSAATTARGDVTANVFVSSSNTAYNKTGAATTAAAPLDSDGLNTLIGYVQNAITAMTSVSSTLGANTNRIASLTAYSQNLSDNLTNGVGALTDADMSAESAKLTSLQTKQSLAIKSLTIANGQSQNILSLFQG